MVIFLSPTTFSVTAIWLSQDLLTINVSGVVFPDTTAYKIYRNYLSNIYKFQGHKVMIVNKL